MLTILKRALLVFLLLTHVDNSSAINQAHKFFTDPAVLSAQMSPNGRYVVTINGIESNQKLVLLNVSTNQKVDLLKLSEFTDSKASLRGINWIDNQYVAAQFSEIKKGVEDLLDTRNVQYLLIIKTPKNATEKAEVLSVRTKGWLVNPLLNESGVFLYAKSSIYSKVYKIRADQLSKHKQRLSKLMRKDGGQFIHSNEVASVKGVATRWFFDNTGKPTEVLNYSGSNELSLSSYNEKGEISELKKWNFDDLEKEKEENQQNFKMIMPVAKAKTENSFYCLDFEEEEERSVYLVNYETNEQELVFEADSFKIIDLIQSPDDNALIGVKVLKDAGIHSVFLDHQQSNPTNKKGIKNSASLSSVISTSHDKKVSLVYRESHNQPGRYLLRNNDNNKEKLIGSSFPQLIGKLNTQQIEQSIDVEGIKISYLLTLPAKKSKKPYPLIVLPHGGPIGVFDHRYFDLGTQYLAANGYAVLRVNYRGSSGHSSELKEAGKRQWGKLMLTDIYRSTLNVSERKDIDKKKICVFGMSYGGYAAAMLTIKHPATYQCAVDVAGISDINLYLNTPNRTDAQEKWLNEYVGDTLTQYDELKSVSPAYLADQLTRPILIIHGAKDMVVDVEHAYRFKLMLEKFNKPFSWHIFEQGEHNFGDSKASILLFSKVKAFIDSHLI